MSGDQLNLDDIEQKARRLAIGARNLSQRELYEDDVPALVAEVRRLRANLRFKEGVIDGLEVELRDLREMYRRASK